MGESDALVRPERAEEDAGTLLSFRDGDWVRILHRPDISDVLLSSLAVGPAGYVANAKNRHERRKNRALLRDFDRLPLVAFPGPLNI